MSSGNMAIRSLGRWPPMFVPPGYAERAPTESYPKRGGLGRCVRARSRDAVVGSLRQWDAAIAPRRKRRIGHAEAYALDADSLQARAPVAAPDQDAGT